MGYTSKRFAVRTINNGMVVVNGKTFRPREYYYQRDHYDLGYMEPYSDQLEGKRCAFSRYITGGEYEGFLNLWGSEEYYFADMETREAIHHNEPNLIDGHYLWDWWYTEDEWERRKEKIDRVGA